MSFVDAAVEAYARERTTPPDEHLRAVADGTAQELGSPMMLTGPVEGRFLEPLVFATRARLVLEIGTFSGYSALSMAAALPEGGRIVTCELETSAPTSPSATSTRPVWTGASRSSGDRHWTTSPRWLAPSTSCSSTPTRAATSTTTRPCCPSWPITA